MEQQIILWLKRLFAFSVINTFLFMALFLFVLNRAKEPIKVRVEPNVIVEQTDSVTRDVSENATWYIDKKASSANDQTKGQ